MSILSIDFETRSTIDLWKTGVYPYAAHPTTDIWCMAFAFDDEEPLVWTPGRVSVRLNDVARLHGHVLAGGEMRAHNAQFERIIWRDILGPRYGFPVPRDDQWVDTAAEVAALALPRSLAGAAKALGLPIEKDDEGRRLMLQMAKPRKPRKGEPKGSLLWWDDPDRLARLVEYCKQDVRVERAIAKRVRRLSETERQVYLLDQKINDRGVHIDLPLVEAAQDVVAMGTIQANRELKALTEGQVTAVTKVADMTKWLQAAGAGVENLRKDTIRDFLDGYEEDDQVRRVAELRQETGKSSTAKLVSFLHVVMADLRARGLFLYHGASTGRWAGKLIQPQNFPRPEVADVERFIPWVMDREFDLIEMEEPALVVVSSMLRSMMTASPGRRLLTGDYGQIEARIVAWIAGQDDLVAAFARGEKIYEKMGSAYSGVPVEEITKDSEIRQNGKGAVLGCGFGMGPDRYAEQTQQLSGVVLPRGERDEEGKLLPGEVDVAALIVGTYRALYTMIPQFWRDINNAARAAVRDPGTITRCGRNDSVRFVVRGQFLWCVLPSGRALAYARPRLERHTVRPKNGEPFTTESVTFMSVDSFTKKWKRVYGYGGLFTENVVQAIARDLLAAAMLRVEDAGYPVVLHAHDEIVADVPEGHGSLEEFLELMRVCPKWAKALPVAVDGWEGIRYRK